MTPFSRKFIRLQDGTLEEFEKEEMEKFQTFVEHYENEELEEGETNPVVYDGNPFFTFDLTCLNRIAFGVADDPFYKPLRAKFFPEVVIISRTGEVIGQASPTKPSDELHGLQYDEGFRDTKLKLNDDKKVKITLSSIKEKQANILLLVKTYDMRKEPPKPGEFDRA